MNMCNKMTERRDRYIYSVSIIPKETYTSSHNGIHFTVIILIHCETLPEEVIPAEPF